MAIPMHKYNGMDVILSSHLTETRKEVVKRSIKERLFSWPWKPMKKTKDIFIVEPSKKAFFTEFGVCMHPVMWDGLKKAIDAKEKQK